MINIKDYYWAVRLDQIQYWFRGYDEILWIELKTAMAPTHDLPMLLMSDLWRPWDSSTLSPPIHASLLAWHYLHKPKTTLTTAMDYNFPIQVMEAMFPQLSTSLLKRCQLNYVQDFIHNSKPKNLKHLIQKYNLPRAAHFTCSRIVHFLRKSPISMLPTQEPAWKTYSCKKPRPKGISLFYNNLQG